MKLLPGRPAGHIGVTSENGMSESLQHIPSTKNQTPNKLQFPNSRQKLFSQMNFHRAPVWILEIDNWNLFGIWSLDFGISFTSPRIPQVGRCARGGTFSIFDANHLRPPIFLCLYGFFVHNGSALQPTPATL